LTLRLLPDELLHHHLRHPRAVVRATADDTECHGTEPAATQTRASTLKRETQNRKIINTKKIENIEGCNLKKNKYLIDKKIHEKCWMRLVGGIDNLYQVW
jgi:hypothetical protein